MQSKFNGLVDGLCSNDLNRKITVGILDSIGRDWWFFLQIFSRRMQVQR